MGIVRVLNIKIGEASLPLGESGVIEFAHITHEDIHGPTIGNHVMLAHRQNMIGGIETEEMGANQGRSVQMEDGNGMLLGQRFGFGQG